MSQILVIDDESDVRVYLQALLEDEGYVVNVAQDCEEGAHFLDSCVPDLLIMDIIMPRQSGLDLYRNIRTTERLKHVPVIMLSAVTKYRHQFSEHFDDIPEPEDFIDKPFHKRIFLERVASILDEKRE
jgi:DNA-binding response OmpR family regulator